MKSKVSSIAAPSGVVIPVTSLEFESNTEYVPHFWLSISVTVNISVEAVQTIFKLAIWNVC